MSDGEIREDNPTPRGPEPDWSWYDLATEERLKRRFHFVAVPIALLLSLLAGAALAPVFGTRAFLLAYLIVLSPLMAFAMELFPMTRPVGSMRHRVLRRTGYGLVGAIIYWTVLAALGLLPNV
jgi:hypothetical protein